jgi:predicted permease
MKLIELVIALLIPIALGFLFKSMKVFDDAESSVIVKFVVRVSFLFIIFRTLYNANFEVLHQIIPLTLSAIVVTVFYFFLSLFIFKYTRANKPQRATLGLSVLYGNYGYLGWGMMFYFFGEGGLTRSIFFMVFFIIVFFLSGFFFVFLIEHKGLEKKALVKILINNTTPPIVTALIALFFKLGGVTIPQVFYKSIDSFANLAIPLILFTIGLNLTFKLDLHRFKLIFIASFSRLILGFVFGVITAVIIKLVFQIDLLSQKVIILESVMPAATMSLFFAEYMECDKELMSTIITFTTLLSLLTVPAWYALLQAVM